MKEEEKTEEKQEQEVLPSIQINTLGFQIPSDNLSDFLDRWRNRFSVGDNDDDW